MSVQFKVIDPMRFISLQTNKDEQNDSSTVIQELKTIAQSFVDERDWQQFHSPKNLSMSVAIEAAELMELFQWQTPEESMRMAIESDYLREHLEEELADVLIYCLNLAYTTNIDITSIILRKIAKNEQKYPVRELKGRF